MVHNIYACSNPQTMQTSLLIFNHVIYIKGMKHALLFSNQAKEHETIVDDIPHYLDHTGYSAFSVVASNMHFR